MRHALIPLLRSYSHTGNNTADVDVDVDVDDVTTSPETGLV